MVLTGQKKLLKNSEIKIAHNVPRIRELKMNFIWDQIGNDDNFFVYMPTMDKSTLPPRNYFFKVLATVYPEVFTTILQNAQEKRKQKMASQNKVLKLDHSLFEDIDQTERTFYQSL